MSPRMEVTPMEDRAKTMKQTPQTPSRTGPRTEQVKHMLRTLAEKSLDLADRLGGGMSPLAPEDVEILRLAQLPAVREISNEMVLLYLRGDTVENIVRIFGQDMSGLL